MRDRWLTVSDVAKILGVTPDAIRGLDRRGWLRANRTLGGVRLFRSSDVERLRQRREKKRAAGRAKGSGINLTTRSPAATPERLGGAGYRSARSPIGQKS
jgi:excisionase family DNA binding protein